MTLAQDPIRDALAWFIEEDETNAGGDSEDSNGYWLAGRRLARQFFTTEIEISEGHARHEARMKTRDHWPEEMDTLPDNVTAHEEIETASRIKEWAKIG